MSEQKGPQPRPTPGPVGCLFILAGRIVGLVTGALLLRLVVELLGLYFCWPQDGARHIFQVVAQEHTELALHLQPHPAGKEILMLLENARAGVLYPRQQINLFFLKDLLDTLAYTLISSLLRLVWLVAILPLLCLCILTGLVDGLVQRDLRRFSTGLESTLYSPARPPNRQLCRHNAADILARAAILFTGNADITACGCRLRDNNVGSGMQF